MSDSNKIEFSTFTAELDEKGHWVYKSKPISPKKQDGTLKKKYKDLPRVEAIYEIEEEMNKRFQENLLDSFKQINNKLIEFASAND